MRRNTRDDEEYRSYITASFDRWARLYDPFLALFRLKGVRRATVEMSGAQPGDRVLDVCTGTGDLALEFARRCDDVVGIDLSSEMLAVAQRKDREGKVRFLRMDATKLDFADKEFDVSAISLALHDMPPEAREETLRELARVTRKRIVIVDYNPPSNPILSLGIEVLSRVRQERFQRTAGPLWAASESGEDDLAGVLADMRLPPG